MGAGGEHAGADYQRTGFPAGTGADSKPPQKMQGRYNADFFRIGKMCGLRLVAVLGGEQAEQQALWLLPLQQERARHTPMLHALHPL